MFRFYFCLQMALYEKIDIVFDKANELKNQAASYISFT